MTMKINATHRVFITNNMCSLVKHETFETASSSVDIVQCCWLEWVQTCLQHVLAFVHRVSKTICNEVTCEWVAVQWMTYKRGNCLSYRRSLHQRSLQLHIASPAQDRDIDYMKALHCHKFSWKLTNHHNCVTGHHGCRAWGRLVTTAMRSRSQWTHVHNSNRQVLSEKSSRGVCKVSSAVKTPSC